MDNAIATAAIKFNMNDMFSVVLTEFGSQHLNKIRVHANNEMIKLNSSHRLPMTVPGDVIEMSLWTFMQMFGSCIHEGAADSPFVGNNIEFVKHM